MFTDEFDVILWLVFQNESVNGW